MTTRDDNGNRLIPYVDDDNGDDNSNRLIPYGDDNTMEMVIMATDPQQR